MRSLLLFAGEGNERKKFGWPDEPATIVRGKGSMLYNMRNITLRIIPGIQKEREKTA